MRMDRIAAFLLGLSCLVASTNLVGCSGDEDTGSAATDGDSGSDGGDVQADTTGPAITLIGSASNEVAFASVFRDSGAEATDDTDGVVAVDRSGSVDTSVSGTYTLTHTASDTSGNTSSVDRSVVEARTTSDLSLRSSIRYPKATTWTATESTQPGCLRAAFCPSTSRAI